MSASPANHPDDLNSCALDGRPVVRSSVVHRLYRTMLNVHARRFVDVDCGLESVLPRTVAIVPSVCDETGLFFRAMGMPLRQAGRYPDGIGPARIVAAGCSRELPRYLPGDFFERGGLLLSSGRTILDVPLPPGLLAIGDPQPPRTVHLTTGDALPKVDEAVHLPAGHLPIDLVDPDDSRVRIISADRTTGEPVVVAVRIADGWLLHSVAHWYQGTCASSTGDLAGPVRAMSLSFLYGLQAVFLSAGYALREVPGHGESAVEGRD